MLSPTVAVAWSGGLVVARRVLTDLREFVDRRNGLSSAEIMEHLRALTYNDWESLSLLGMIARECDSHIFWSNALTRNFAQFGNVAAAGSGANDLFSYLEKIDSKKIEISPLYLSGPMALSSEFFSASGLASGYGGGYEVADRQTAQITKQDNTLYAFWFLDFETAARLNENEDVAPLIAPPVFIKHTYFGEHLFIVRAEPSLRLHTIRDRKMGRGKLHFSVADSPFINKKEMHFLLNEEFFEKTDLLISMFFLRGPSGGVEVVYQMDSGEPFKDLLKLQVYFRNRRFDVIWDSKYWLRLKEDILRREAYDFPSWF